MIKKFLSLFLILCLIFAISNISYATDDVVMDLSEETVDDTLYNANDNLDETTENEETDEIPLISTDYDVSSDDELSISNFINIILIVVGIVLILLGIAILTKLK